MKRYVIALLAVDEVIAVTAEQQVNAVAAQQRVIASAAVDGDLDQRREVAGSGEGVVAAVGVEHEVLAGANIYGERSRVEAIEAHPGAIGGRGEDLGAVAAVDFDRVVAGTALIEVRVVAGVPDHPVVPRLAEDLVVGITTREGVVVRTAEEEIKAALAQQSVVTGLAKEHVATGAARERVVAGTAEQVRPRQGPVGLVQRNGVVPPLAKALHQGGVGDRGRPTRDGDRAAVDQDIPGGVAADLDGVIQGVAKDISIPAPGIKVAVTASISRGSMGSKPETNRAGRFRRVTERRADRFFRNLTNLDIVTSLCC